MDVCFFLAGVLPSHLMAILLINSFSIALVGILFTPKNDKYTSGQLKYNVLLFLSHLKSYKFKSMSNILTCAT